MKSRLLLLVLLICMMLSTMLQVSAISVVGGLLETDVAPGEQIKHEITLSIDDNENSTEVTAGVFGYGLNLDGGRAPLSADADVSPYSAREFLKISPETATLNPGVPVTFVLEGRVPDDVGSGGRYAMVSLSTPPRGSGQVGIALAAFVPVILTISGSNLIETGEITNVTVSKDNVSAIFENTGNYHFKASAEAILKDDKGNVIANATEPLSHTSITPTASCLFEMAFNNKKDLAPGTYAVEVSVIHKNGTVLDTAEKTIKV